MATFMVAKRRKLERRQGGNETPGRGKNMFEQEEQMMGAVTDQVTPEQADWPFTPKSLMGSMPDPKM